ncbi:MAG: glycosyltransferase [Microbacterium gubbeenense]
MTLWIDRRWSGQHGIGRYAAEVYSRLSVRGEILQVSSPTAAGLSAFASVPKGLIYSPGYGAFVRAERQILTIHDLIHLQTPWPGRAKYAAYYNAIARPVIRRSGVVLTVSETSRQAIADWLRDPSVEIVNAGIGASTAFHVDVVPAEADTPYVMYVGNLREHKNLRTVIRALKHTPGIALRALVPASEHAAALEYATEHRVADQLVLFAGISDDELARQYRGAVATVMPSVLEGFGLPPLESVMTGTPVIFWRGCAAVAETVEDRGWAVDDAYKSEAWAERMIEAESKRQRVTPPTGRYDWSSTVNTIDSTLRKHLET